MGIQNSVNVGVSFENLTNFPPRSRPSLKLKNEEFNLEIVANVCPLFF